MSKKPTLLIAVEGGLVSAVCTDIPVEFEDVIIVDYDCETVDEADKTEVKQADGSYSPALVSHPWVEKIALPLEQFKLEGDE